MGFFVGWFIVEYSIKRKKVVQVGRPFRLIYFSVHLIKLSRNWFSGRFFPMKTNVEPRFVSFQSRPLEISKLI